MFRARTINEKTVQAAINGNGDIVSFESAFEKPLSELILNIEPTQTGTGDPSPTNERPFSGWTEAVVRQRPKNFCSELWADASPYGLTWEKNSEDKSIHVSGTSTNSSAGVYRCSGQFWLPKGEYIASGFGAYGTSPYLRLRGYPKGSSTASLILRSGNGNFTLSEDTLCDIGIYVSAHTTADITYYPMIRLASESDATYEPSKYNAYNISWSDTAGTIYGGTLDVVRGKLRVTYLSYDMGEINWSYYRSGEHPVFRVSFSRRKYGTNADGIVGYCSSYKFYGNYVLNALTSNMPDKSFGFQTTAGWTNFRDDDYTSVESFKEAVAGQLIVYPLATPIEYDIDPVTIQTLLGQNNVWADTGDIAQLAVDPITGKLKFKLIQ